MKKMLAVLVAACVLALGLVACSSTTSSSTPASTSSSVASTSEPASTSTSEPASTSTSANYLL